MPILSYSTDHYFRCYVKIINSVSQANHCLDFFKIVNSSQLPWILKSKKDIGPLWTGDLHNKNILKELVSILLEKELKTKNSLSMKLDLFFEESDAPIFFYTSDSLSSFFNKSPPKQQFIFDFLKKNSFNVFRTHFSPTGFKTNAGKNEIEKVFN
jgi:tRNA (guanine26-N2/guanine27-N2)-dimethyltransferase